MLAERKAIFSWPLSLATAFAARYFVPQVQTIHPALYWTSAIFVTAVLVARRIAAGNPIPAKILKENADMTGKIVIVTGPATGLGFESALFYAVRGATVVLATRSVQRNEDTATRLRARPEAQGKTLKFITKLAMNGESLDSAKDFALKFLEEKLPLDILMLNHGLIDWIGEMQSSFHKNIEFTACINFFSHIVISEHLMAKIKECNTRVVCLSSIAHRRIPKNPDGKTADDLKVHIMKCFDDMFALSAESATFKKYSNWERYGISKLGNIFHANYLVSQGVAASCVHPGVVSTNFVVGAGKIIETIAQVLGPYIALKKEDEGAWTQIYASLCPESEIVNAPGNLVSKSPKTGLVNKQATFFCDCLRKNESSSLLTYAQNLETANNVMVVALAKLKPWL